MLIYRNGKLAIGYRNFFDLPALGDSFYCKAVIGFTGITNLSACSGFL